MPKAVLALAISYLLGSIPSGYLTGYAVKRKDPRWLGSGNVGGMNVLRHIGFLPGIGTILMDVGKGVLAALICRNLVGSAWAWMALPVAVAGHMWMPWLGFQGGKGLAVAGGILLIMHWPVALMTYALLGGLTLWLKNSDLASLLVFAFLPFLMWWWGSGVTGALAAGLVTVENLFRLGPALYKWWQRHDTF